METSKERTILHLKQSLFLFLAISTLTAVALTPKVGFMRFSGTFLWGSEEASFVIQEAINDANDGDVIEIPSGIYYERVLVNKTVSLFGEEDFTTVIDGGNGGTVVEITADNVTIAFLKLQNSGYGWMRHGVYVDTADNCTIRNNLLQNNCHVVKLNYSRNSHVTDNRINGTMTSPTMYGIRIENSTNCTISGNDVSDCVGAIHLQNATDCVVSNNCLHGNSQGIRMYSPCSNDRFFDNSVRDGTYDGMIDNTFGDHMFTDNSFFHNNFINNANPFIYKASGFSWDDGYPSGGNYWSRYNETDSYSGVYQNETGYDGIGDVYSPLGDYDKDRYPLMHPFGSVWSLNTKLTYHTIQSAIDSDATVNGHTIIVKNGIYKEHLTINKTISIIGENKTSTTIDGQNTGTVVTVKTDNVTVAGFTIRNSGLLFPPYGNDCGVLLDNCAGVNVSHNVITDSRIGLYIFYSEGNIIEQNTVNSNQEDGILLWYAGSNVLANNTMSDNTRNFGVFGNDFQHFDNSVDQSNTVDSKLIQYLIGNMDLVIENRTDVGVLYLVNCTNITVRNMEFTNNNHGVFCFDVTDSRIENVTSSSNGYGVSLQNSAGNLVRRNQFSDNWVGVLLQEANENGVEGNMIVDGEKGISLYEADSNILTGNTIDKATFGIRAYASSFNSVFHNNFMNNVEQASILSGSQQNTWDNNVEGNYWSDYAGQDDNRDGLGEEHCAIDSQNEDSHPLMGGFHTFQASYNGSEYWVSIVTNSTVLGFAFDESSNTIRLTVNGSEGTHGFCRIQVPHALVKPELTVIIDNGLTPLLHENYTLLDDGSDRWIYFAYSHSTHEVIIVQELQMLALWLVLASLLHLLLYKFGSSIKR